MRGRGAKHHLVRARWVQSGLQDEVGQSGRNEGKGSVSRGARNMAQDEIGSNK